VKPNEHLEVKHLLDVFAERPTEVLDGKSQSERRVRVISHIQQVMREPHPAPLPLVRRLRWVEATATLALAAGLALVVGRFATKNTPVVPVSALHASSSAGSVLCEQSDGSQWIACNPQQTTRLVGLKTLAGGTVNAETLVGVRLALEPSSTLRVNEANQSKKASQVTLSEGSVHVEVPKLGPGRQFSVLTPDTTITVHGTAFTVSLIRTEQQTVHTCVELREGIIEVQSKGRAERLTAPARFGCDGANATSGDARADATPVVDASALPSEPANSAEGALGPETSRRHNHLAQETRWLQMALGAERRHDYATAEKSLRLLLATNPKSVVAPEARAALERIAARKQ
jgi:ferric-dicitrate binding protein FerR (iron transport regulator)